jgi:CO/xanthine dehydrogenase FAD-binding subunit
MRIREFDYRRPASLDEALGLLGDYGADAKVIAGGTDLLVLMKKKLVRPQVLVDLSALTELSFIEEREDGLHIGPLTTLSDLLSSPNLGRNYGILKQAVTEIGSWQIRNRATLGGNLCNASPAADSAPALLVLDARLRLRSSSSERVIRISDFFTGPRLTLLAPSEMLVEIVVPRPHSPSYSQYLKFSRRRKVDLALVGVGLLFFAQGRVIQEARIALGGVAPTPICSENAGKILSGRILESSLLAEVARACVEESACISDVRASGEYREEIIKALVKKGLSKIMAAMEQP